MSSEEKIRAWNKFKLWVEGTSLFYAIKEGTKRLNSGSDPLDYYTIQSNEIIFTINKGIIVKKLEDLPIEIVLNFLVNCPYEIVQENKQLIFNKIAGDAKQVEEGR